jgi:RNA polymerase sigma factor (sigma-70 family)
MVKGTLRGDRNAYAELVQVHQARLVASAGYLCGDPETAQDLAQEAFITAYQSLRGLREPAAFGAWLHGILRNLCRKHLARRPPAPASLEQDDVPEPSTPPDTSVEVAALLQTLTLEHREVLAARYLQDMDYEEIAQMLGLTVNNVRVRCFRAREALRVALAGAGGVGSG